MHSLSVALACRHIDKHDPIHHGNPLGVLFFDITTFCEDNKYNTSFSYSGFKKGRIRAIITLIEWSRPLFVYSDLSHCRKAKYWILVYACYRLQKRTKCVSIGLEVVLWIIYSDACWSIASNYIKFCGGRTTCEGNCSIIKHLNSFSWSRYFMKVRAICLWPSGFQTLVMPPLSYNV